MEELASTVIIRDGKALFVKDGRGFWRFPGGKVGGDESPTEAAVRYTEDALGSVELEKPLYSGEYQEDGDMYLWHGYIGSLEKNLEVTESSNLKWFGAEDLRDMDVSKGVGIIEPALRNLLD